MNLSLSPQFDDALTRAAGASVSAAILILIGAILFAVFPRMFGPRWRFAFGIVVLVRLLIPFAPESRLSVFNLWKSDSGDSSIEAVHSPAASSRPLGLAPEIPKFESPTHPEIEFTNALSPPAWQSIPREEATAIISPGMTAPEMVETNELNSPFNVLPLLWITGAVLLFGWAFARNIRFAILLRCWGSRAEDDRLRGILDQCRQTLGIRRRVLLMSAPRLQSAAIFGWIRPRLLIADNFGDRFTDVEIRGIFLHELAHVRRHDVVWNWLAHLALAIHWFNPLVWIAVRRFRADREQICDAIVLERLSSRQRRTYGATLITLVEEFSGASGAPAAVPALAPFLTRKSELKNRINMINQDKKSAHWVLQGIAAVLLAVAGAVTFTSAVADDDDVDAGEERREGERERRNEREQPENRDGRRGPAESREEPESRERRGEDHERGGENGRRDGDRDENREHDGDRRSRFGHREGDHDHDDHEHGELPPEVREFIGLIGELRETVGDLSRVGKRKEAHDVEEQIEKLLREHPEMARRFHEVRRGRENNEIARELHDLEAALEHALEDGNEAEAREIRERLERIRHETRRRDEGEHAKRRIHHLREAAENLEAAGLHDQARELHHQAEEIEQELRHHHAEGRDEELARHAEHLEREVAELKEVVGDLREEVEKLQRQLRAAKDERD